MAKGFPYFKFIATEWLTGDIVYEPLSVQGLFINICSVYWQRGGELTIEDVKKRYKNPPELEALTDGFISVSDGIISIKFLDEQLEEAAYTSKKNTDNGLKGGRPKKTQNNPTVSENNPSETQNNLNRIRIREDKEEERKNTAVFSPTGGAFFELYEKMMEVFKRTFTTYFRDDKIDYAACNHIARKIEILKEWEKGSCMNGRMNDFLGEWERMTIRLSENSFLSKMTLTDLSDKQWQRWCTSMVNLENGTNSKEKKSKTVSDEKLSKMSDYERDLYEKREAAKNKQPQ